MNCGCLGGNVDQVQPVRVGVLDIISGTCRNGQQVHLWVHLTYAAFVNPLQSGSIGRRGSRGLRCHLLGVLKAKDFWVPKGVAAYIIVGVYMYIYTPYVCIYHSLVCCQGNWLEAIGKKSFQQAKDAGVLSGELA